MVGGKIIMIFCIIFLVSTVVQADKIWDDIIQCVMDPTNACDVGIDDPNKFCTNGRGNGNSMLNECQLKCHKKFYPASK